MQAGSATGLVRALTPLLLLWPLVAGAQPAPQTRVVLLPPVFGETIPPAAQDSFRAAVRQGLVSGLRGTEFLGPQEAQQALAGDASALGCRSAACLSALGRTLSAWALVAVEGGEELGTYTMQLRAAQGSDGEVLVERTATCEICTLEEAVTGLARAGKELGEELSRQAAALPPPTPPTPPTPPPPAAVTVRVVSHPEGAAVILDGELTGLTPLELTLPPGEHLFAVEKEAFLRSERRLAVGTSPLAVEFRLKPETPPAVAELLPPTTSTQPQPPPAEEQWLSYDALGFVGLGLGLASTALGAVLIGLDGEATCDGPIEQCPTLYDTKVGGIVVTTVGAGLLVGSAVLFLLEEDEASRPAADRTTPGKDPATAAAPSMGLSLLPWFGPDGGGVLLRGGLGD